MSEEVKYCFYCGIKLNRTVKYCPGCGTHIDEEPSFEIKEAQSMQETSSTTQSTKPESIEDEPSSVNSSTNNGIGLAAIQINKPFRIFVIRPEDLSKKNSLEEAQIYINPKFSNPSKRTNILSEACLMCLLFGK